MKLGAAAKLRAWSRRLPGLFRPRDLQEAGIPTGRLRMMIARGEVDRIGRGLYRRRNLAPSEHETVAMVSKRVPGAIICLLTALHVHRIGTQVSKDVWIALDRKARKPRLSELPIRVIRFSGPMLRYGVLARDIEGVTCRITSPARTVVDCFRYRNKVGLDVALEALRDVLRTRRATVDEISRAAEVCRILSVIRPYIEAMVS
ncbi:MAG: type IV toxin-antitoxin system AbiEi family antitoxin domain-containing protein [Acidobacteria bacterium]|nr:type IV toxin-antitoxin system AbiEi family antitoxin domain-containing protein [Acidobacteriota bacterium]